MKMTHFSSRATRFSSLEIIDYPRMAPGPSRVSVLDCPITDSLAGDIIVVLGHFEVTNDLTYAVEVARRVTLETGTGGINGTLISPDAGENATPQIARNEQTRTIQVWHGQHHMLIPFSGVYTFTEDAALRYVSVGAYAGGSSYTKPGDWLKVETTTNHLDVLRFRDTGVLEALIAALIAKNVLTQEEIDAQLA